MLSIALLALSRITLEPDVAVHDPKTFAVEAPQAMLNRLKLSCLKID